MTRRQESLADVTRIVFVKACRRLEARIPAYAFCSRIGGVRC